MCHSVHDKRRSMPSPYPYRPDRGNVISMSEKHPECPLYNPLNCKEYYNPKLCAFVRKDKECLKKKKPKSRAKTKSK